MFILRRFYVLFIVLCMAAPLIAQEKPRIAVMNLKAEGVSEKTASVISSMLRTEFVNSGKFIIIEREQMDSILKEQGFQQTGCTDQACVVEVGRLLSARKMLVGEVIDFQDSLYINIRIVDVEKSEVDVAEKEVIPKDSRLDQPIELLSKKLISRIVASKSIVVKQREKKSSSFPIVGGVVPSGFTFSWMMMKPTGTVFKNTYNTMHGGMLGYLYPFNNYVTLSGNIYVAASSASNSDANAFFNGYALGARIGIPVFKLFYPYTGLSAKGILLVERGSAESASFGAFGINVSAGLATMFMRHLGVYTECSYDWARVADKNKTDISGLHLNVGIVYSL